MGLAIGIALAGAGIGAGAAQLFSGSQDSPNMPNPPALPDPNQASQDAAKKITNQREILLRSGGQTDYTGGTGVLTGTDVSKTTLLGG